MAVNHRRLLVVFRRFCALSNETDDCQDKACQDRENADDRIVHFVSHEDAIRAEMGQTFRIPQDNGYDIVDGHHKRTGDDSAEPRFDHGMQSGVADEEQYRPRQQQTERRDLQGAAPVIRRRCMEAADYDYGIEQKGIPRHDKERLMAGKGGGKRKLSYDIGHKQHRQAKQRGDGC